MKKQYFLGLDLGSSSVKASLVDVETGKCAATTSYPGHEAPIIAIKSGWAEQDTEMWWNNCKLCINKVKEIANASGEDIISIGSHIKCMVWCVLIKILRCFVRQ